MAMLAERKQKVKWVINPTKKPLWKTNEEGGVKFGMQLMEKMGWTPGKGLGLHEQGVSEPIRLGYKGDTKGMGFKDADDDWIQHQDEFNSLLNSLANGETNKVSIAEEDSTKNSVKSLEEKSKNSRARVHYQKFTRGKDLSRYSENDLACILGNRKKKHKEDENLEEKVESNPQTDEDTENSFGVTTINGGSITDYFRKKLGTTNKPPMLQENKESGDFEEGSQPKEFDARSEKKSELKKKNKKTLNLEENFDSNEKAADGEVDQDQNWVKKKKKKKDREEEKILVSENDPSPSQSEETCQLAEPEVSCENSFLLSDCEKKKNKKRKKEAKVENEEDVQLSKKKKKKSRHQEEFLEPVIQPVTDEINEEPKKKKKKKKKKTSESEAEPPFQNVDTIDPDISNQNPVDFSAVGQRVVENQNGFKENQLKASKKNLGQNKIFDLICDAQIAKFKGSNLEGLTGYGLFKPKR